MTVLVAIQTGSDDVLLGIPPPVTSSLQMLCRTPEVQRGAVGDSIACAEDFWISLPHGLLAIIALPPLVLGCPTSKNLYAAV